MTNTATTYASSSKEAAPSTAKKPRTFVRECCYNWGMGNNVRHWRKLKGMSGDELARRSGVSRRALVNIEHGHSSPRVATLIKIAHVLEVPIEKLVTEESEEDRVKTPA
jgi:DNA-binding XRE family transcriptional regulator